jgi:hypothetical protein
LIEYGLIPDADTGARLDQGGEDLCFSTKAPICNRLPISAAWNEMVMGLLVLGYGIVAAGFYAFAAKTSKPAPQLQLFETLAIEGGEVIDISDRYKKQDQKAA